MQLVETSHHSNSHNAHKNLARAHTGRIQIDMLVAVDIADSETSLPPLQTANYTAARRTCVMNEHPYTADWDSFCRKVRVGLHCWRMRIGLYANLDWPRHQRRTRSLESRRVRWVDSEDSEKMRLVPEVRVAFVQQWAGAQDSAG